MPPQRKCKSSTEKKEEAERKKKILASKEKILSIKRSVVAIVEASIEKDISEEWFLANCVKLCHADYDDVVQERSIERLCGYPLCSNIIKQTFKQNYHISRATNKVYDLTERKCFCSNQCYKASNYLKAQLSPIPLYMREEGKIEINLLLDSDNKGSAGEEVVFEHKISPDAIDEVHKNEGTSNNLQNMLNEEVKKMGDCLKDLKIKEHVFDKEYVFGEEIPKEADSSELNNKEPQSDPSDDSSDENFFPSYDNTSVLSERHMPIPKTKKKIQFIGDLPKVSPVPQKLSLDFAIKVFEDWMTEDSMKYLLGEKFVYGVKADHLFEKMTADDSLKSEKLESIKNEYINLCLKIDSLPDYDEEDDANDLFEIGLNESSASTASTKVKDGHNPEKKVFKKRPKEKFKRVTFTAEPKAQGKSLIKESIKTVDSRNVELETEKQVDEAGDKNNSKINEEIDEEASTDCSVPEKLPLVDSVSQNILRRQLVISKLKSVYIELLPVVGLHYTNIRDAVKKFVDTLSLTPMNIILKPKEWKLISIVLLRVLTKTVLKDIHDDDQFLKLCKNNSLTIVVDVTEVEQTVDHIISIENILSIKTSIGVHS